MLFVFMESIQIIFVEVGALKKDLKSRKLVNCTIFFLSNEIIQNKGPEIYIRGLCKEKIP